ncbi:hypothetical protein SO802_008073 [Lithocarpus litseifolius]|uniref:S-protein homolog n=1 Tax=Lithocarpus litseifolius TaxID=425828 RepID=A0AAW2DBQ2_9ROSI
MGMAIPKEEEQLLRSGWDHFKHSAIIAEHKSESESEKADEFEVWNYATQTSKLNGTCANHDEDFPSFFIAYATNYTFSIENANLNINCEWEWTGVSHKFEIYNVDRDICVTCLWYLKPDGPCFQDQLRGGEQCYPWDS